MSESYLNICQYNCNMLLVFIFYYIIQPFSHKNLQYIRFKKIFAQHCWVCGIVEPYWWSMVLLQAFVSKKEEITAVRITPWHNCTTTGDVWCAVSLQVELLVMKALSVGLIKGNIDEVDQKVQMTWVQPRVLDVQQVKRWHAFIHIHLEKSLPFTCMLPELKDNPGYCYDFYCKTQYLDYTTLAL